MLVSSWNLLSNQLHIVAQDKERWGSVAKQGMQ